MNVGNQQDPERVQLRRPTLRRERSLGEGEAVLEQPAVGIPHGGEIRIQEARYDDVHVALQYLENSLVRIDPPPFPAGHHAGRWEPSRF